MNSRYYHDFHDLLANWIDEDGSKQILNCITEYLAEDISWIKLHISEVDKETLKLIAAKL